MRAGWYENNGEARDVLIVGDSETPAPGPGEVRVRLKFSGVNPSDVKARLRRPMIAPRIIPHSGGAGIIDFNAGSPEVVCPGARRAAGTGGMPSPGPSS